MNKKPYSSRKNIHVPENDYKIILKAKKKQSFSRYVIDAAVYKANQALNKL